MLFGVLPSEPEELTVPGSDPTYYHGVPELDTPGSPGGTMWAVPAPPLRTAVRVWWPRVVWRPNYSAACRRVPDTCRPAPPARGNRHLTYGIVNWPRQLSHESVQLAVGAAFQLWSNVSGLVFQEVTRGPADIRLAFYAGEHDDGLDNAFDGPGGALAHAFFPRRGEAHFDMAERWTLSGLKGHNLFLVVAHEIGHTLGLEHSPVRHALMSPYYKKLGHALLLSWDDVAAVQQLYGERLSRVTSPAFVTQITIKDGISGLGAAVALRLMKRPRNQKVAGSNPDPVPRPPSASFSSVFSLGMEMLSSTQTNVCWTLCRGSRRYQRTRGVQRYV
uniref:Peptidase metallopeptidase domain-containing protein n=1 Tax=Denticeps clupeoides TaxID=299321 RepID=A0AAY4D6J8_9TELE